MVAIAHIVAWVVEGKKIPGYKAKYPDADLVGNMDRVLLFCDVLPWDIDLGPKVKHLPGWDQDKMMAIYGFDGGTNYLNIDLVRETSRTMTFEVISGYGPLHGHKYRITFRYSKDSLSADGKLLWTA
jgi:hypothetical protein